MTLSSAEIDAIVDELCPTAPVWHADTARGVGWGTVHDNRGQLFTHSFTERSAYSAGNAPLAVIGGIYAGADSRMRTGDWDLIHDQTGDPGDDCLGITCDAPGENFLVSGCAFDSTFDPIAPSKGVLANQSNAEYLIEHCYGRVVRDDFLENDGCMVGTLRSVLVDGTFMLLSMRNTDENQAQYTHDGHTTLEEVYVRFSCLPHLGSNSSGCPVGYGGGSKIFKAGDKTGSAAYSKCFFLWEARSNNLTEEQSWRPDATYSSVYVLYAPGGTPQPFFDLSILPSGVTDLGSHANAFDVWTALRDKWLNQHDCRPKDGWFGFTCADGGSHPAMPDIGPIQDSWSYDYGPAVEEPMVQYCEVAHDAVLALSAATLVAWCKPASLHDGAIVSKRAIAPAAAIDGDFTMRLVADGQVSCFGRDSANPEGATQYVQSASGFYAANDVLCIALQFGSGGFALWINGEHIITNSDYTLGWTGSPLRIGYAGYGTGGSEGHPFDGLIDEVMVWDRRLTGDELRIVAQAAPVAFDFNMGSVEADGGPISVDLAAHVQALSGATFLHSPISSNFGAWSRVGSDLTYTPDDSGDGIDSCSYSVMDDLGEDTATVTATVQPAISGEVDTLALLYPYTSSDNVNAGSPGALATAVNAAPPGRHIKVTANLTSLGTLTFTGDGTALAPIVIRPDGALLSRTLSNGTINLDGSYLVLAGFNLTNVRVNMRGHHNRVTRNKYLLKAAYAGAVITGDDNRFDHNDVSDVTVADPPVADHGYGVKSTANFHEGGPLPRRQLIDRNYLHDVVDQGGTNGHECIQITSGTGNNLYNNFTRIEYNLVDTWVGEGECCSTKGPYVHFKGNTALNSGNWGTRNSPHLSEGEWLENMASFRVRMGAHTGPLGDVIPATVIRDLWLVNTPLDFFQGDLTTAEQLAKEISDTGGSPSHPPADGATAYNVVSDDVIRVGRWQGNGSFGGVNAINNRIERAKRPNGTDMTVANGGIVTSPSPEYRQSGTTISTTTSEPSVPAVKLTTADVGINADDPLDTLNGAGPPSW